MFRALILMLGTASFAAPAGALNILLVNDDGLSANIQAQYTALISAGHDVLVSVPCQNQSGKGASLDLVPLAPLTQPCRNGAADMGAPGAGPVAGKQGFYYVNGTPLMATAYGLDVLAPRRWGRPPDLVLSGPNEGQNAGPLINSSGTVSNALFASARGVCAIAVSADADTADDPARAFEVAPLVLRILAQLEHDRSDAPLLPRHVVLNINYPRIAPHRGRSLKWHFSRVGTYSSFALKFAPHLKQSPYVGLTVESNAQPPSSAQSDDEAVALAAGMISVSVIRAGFDADEKERAGMRRRLGGLVNRRR